MSCIWSQFRVDILYRQILSNKLIFNDSSSYINIKLQINFLAKICPRVADITVVILVTEHFLMVFLFQARFETGKYDLKILTLCIFCRNSNMQVSELNVR